MHTALEKDTQSTRLELAEGPFSIVRGFNEDELEFLNAFSEQQRKRMLKKIDWRLIPLLSFLYLISYLDRANIGNANIEGLSIDLGLDGRRYNICLCIFFVPYILLEIPCNIVLKRFKRPSHWMAIMTVSWALVLMCTGWVNNFGGLATCRLLLGVAEAGFFPGAIMIVSNWYSRRELGVRIALFYTASALAGAFSGLLAYLIAKMDGLAGYAGWRWIFILEGALSLAVGLVLPWILIDTPSLSTWLSVDERRFLILRKECEDGSRNLDAKEMVFSWRIVLATLSDWKIYLLAIVALSNTIPNYGFKFTMPQIMKNMGYTSANAQLLTIPPYVLGAFSAFVSAAFSDRHKWRMPFIVGPQLLVLVGFAISFAYARDIENRIGEMYFAVSLACIGLYPIIPGANAWNANNLAGPLKRSAGIAYLGTFASAGGLAGSFIYIESEAPTYPTGFGTSLAMAGAGVAAALLLEIFLWRINARDARLTVQDIKDRYTDDELIDMGDKSPLFKYIL